MRSRVSADGTKRPAAHALAVASGAPAVCAALHPQRADASAAENARARTLAQDCYDTREREAADRRRVNADRLWEFYVRNRR